MNINSGNQPNYNEEQFKKQFKEEFTQWGGRLSKDFISTKTYSEKKSSKEEKSELDIKMEQVTKFFGIHSADVIKKEDKNGEYRIVVTIPRSAFTKIGLKPPEFVYNIIEKMRNLPHDAQMEVFLDLSEEDFHEMDKEDFEGMIAKMGFNETSKKEDIDDAIIMRFETKIVKLQKTREALIQTFTKIKNELALGDRDPDVQHIISALNPFLGPINQAISFKIVNARNALDKNITILRTPLLSLEQMQKALGTKNDLETKEKVKEIKSEDLFNRLKTYLKEQHEAIIEAPFKQLAIELTGARVEELSDDTEKLLVGSFIMLFAKKMVSANPDVLIHFLNTPLMDEARKDLTLKSEILYHLRRYIEKNISSDVPRESRLNAWNTLIALYRKKDLIKDEDLRETFSRLLSDLRSVNEISDMDKELELVRLIPPDPGNPNNIKDRRLEVLIRRLVSLKPPAIKKAEELILEVSERGKQTVLRIEIGKSIQRTYETDLVNLKDTLFRKLDKERRPEIEQAYGKAHTEICERLETLSKVCNQALDKSIAGNENSLSELHDLLENGKSNTLKEVIKIIKELFSTLRTKLDDPFFLESTDFFKRLMGPSPFLTRELISNVGHNDKEIHQIFNSIIERESNRSNVTTTILQIVGLLKSIPHHLNGEEPFREDYRNDIENKAVELIERCIDRAHFYALDDVRLLVIECVHEISQDGLKARLLFTYIRKIRHGLAFNSGLRSFLIGEIPGGVVNDEVGRTYRRMAEDLFEEHQPADEVQNPLDEID